MVDPHERLSQLRTAMTERLATASPSLVVSAVPLGRASATLDATGDELRRWLGRQVGGWPAPVALDAGPSEIRAGTVTFRPPPAAGTPTVAYHCEFHADGSALSALEVGTLRDDTPDGAQVWALGEGALAWITVAMLRLTTAFVAHAGGPDRALVEASLTSHPGGGGASPVASTGEVPMEIWSHAHGTYGPGGERLAHVQPVGGTVDVAACLSPGLTLTARPFVLGLLQQFGITGSRHIDDDGVLRRGRFTGHDERIRAWADTIGVPSAP